MLAMPLHNGLFKNVSITKTSFQENYTYNCWFLVEPELTMLTRHHPEVVDEMLAMPLHDGLFCGVQYLHVDAYLLQQLQFKDFSAFLPAHGPLAHGPAPFALLFDIFAWHC